MFSVRSVASATGFYLRESGAAAADVFCAKAQCQRSDSNRVLSPRKRSDSNNNTKLNKEWSKVKQIKIIKIKNFSCFCIFYIIQF